MTVVCCLLHAQKRRYPELGKADFGHLLVEPGRKKSGTTIHTGIS